MEIKQKLLNLFWRNRHWSTKLIWTIGLLLVVTCTILVLTFPPSLVGKGYTFVYGQAIKQGVLNNSIGILVPLNISCNTSSDCPFVSNTKMCGGGICYGGGTRIEPDLGSFSFRVYDSNDPTLVGKEIAVKGDLKEGEWARLALEGVEIQDKGLWLWGEQRRVLSAFWLPGFVVLMDEEASCSGGDCGWDILLIYAIIFLYFVGGFVFPYDRFLVRVFTSVFVGCIILPTVSSVTRIVPQLKVDKSLVDLVLYIFLLPLGTVYQIFVYLLPFLLIFVGVSLFIYYKIKKLSCKKSRNE